MAYININSFAPDRFSLKEREGLTYLNILSVAPVGSGATADLCTNMIYSFPITSKKNMILKSINSVYSLILKVTGAAGAIYYIKSPSDTELSFFTYNSISISGETLKTYYNGIYSTVYTKYTDFLKTKIYYEFTNSDFNIKDILNPDYVFYPSTMSRYINICILAGCFNTDYSAYNAYLLSRLVYYDVSITAVIPSVIINNMQLVFEEF